MQVENLQTKMDTDSASTTSVSSNINKNKESIEVTLDEILESSNLTPDTLASIRKMQKICDFIQISNDNNQDNINNPGLQKEIFDFIDKIYFFDFKNWPENEKIERETFLNKLNFNNTFEYEMKKYELKLEDFNVMEIKKNLKRLQIQYEVVCRKVSDIILKNSQAYSIELQRVSDFKALLEDSAQICSISRRFLSMTESVFIISALKLIKNNIKRTNLVNMLKSIQAIKELVNNI